MVRKGLFAVVCLGSVALTLSGVGTQEGAAQVLQPPNILVVITDDQRYDTMGLMPAAQREFGQGGEQFVRAFVTTPLCCPSRSSIFTGQYAHNHGVVKNHGEGLDASKTWQRYLHDAGYLTGIAGKYLNGTSTKDAPNFDFRRNWPLDDPDDPRRTAASAKYFLSLSEQDDSQPWALVLAPHSPHKPYTVSPAIPQQIPAFEPSPGFEEGDLRDKEPAVQTTAAFYWPPDPPRVWRQAAPEIQALDEMIASVFANLGAYGEDQNTLAFFISDNGFQLGEHKLMSKGWPYTASVQVPLYARWPGHIAPGTVSNALVANIDIAPTIYEATGVSPGYVVDGRTLLAPSGRERLLLEMLRSWTPRPGHEVPAWTAIWRPKQHYIHWEDGFVEDYDLNVDPGETHARNRLDPHLEAQLDRFATCAGPTCP